MTSPMPCSIFIYNPAGAPSLPTVLNGSHLLSQLKKRSPGRILTDINPVLQKQPGFNYTIIICGKDIPAAITAQSYPNVLFAGFVNDITTYFKGCDVFINAITEGGGIKTKLVEALGYNLNAVSTTHGAIGIDPVICHGKLQITDDIATGFAEKIVQLAGYTANIPAEFFDHFYWDNIAQKAARFIEQ
jgi:glycosyltransferase involved in cell wall biosynthesis